MPTNSITSKPQLAFFAGKGGVGKTTLAAAYAVTQARAGRRVLVVSTDPAHSLGDVLGQRLSSRPRPVPLPRSSTASRRTGTLDAIELDAGRAFARWMTSQRAGVALALQHGTWLDRADIDILLTLPVPGIDELAGVLEIVSYSEARRYDALVVDTAPTGHALRLLAAPGELASVAAALDALQADHRTIREQFARVGRTDAADAVIAYLSREAQASGALLRDGSRTMFHWVMLPEALSLAETDDGLRALEAAGIQVGWLVVNRVIAAGGACPICDRLRAEETRVIAEASTRLTSRARMQLVYETAREPRGVEALRRVRRVTAGRRTIPQGRTPGSARYSVPATHPDGRRALLQRLEGAELVFVAGKGGVGKTTVAAALAIELSREHGGRRTLLLSTDPAHSAGDALRRQAGDTAARVSAREPLLWVRELDAPAALAAQRVRLQAALQELAHAAGASADATQLSGLLDLAPPGLDELVGMLSVLDARDAYATVVVDMAPTGHALRLLEMPETTQAWAQALLRILLKYRELVRPGQLASSLVSLSRSIRQLRGVLADARLARAVVVTRAAAVPAAEHSRLVSRLRRLGLEVAGVVVNARTLDPGGCARCRGMASAERLVLPALKSASHRGARASIMVEAPLAAPPPRGAAALRAWAQTWTT